MISWLKNNRNVVNNSFLFFVVFVINISYYIIPSFSIPFYEDSSHFIYLLSMRLDFLFIIAVFYIKTALPKEFKLSLLLISLVVLMSIINILPFEDENIHFYTYAVFVTVVFILGWVLVMSVEKWKNSKYLRSNMIMLNKERHDTFKELLDEIKTFPPKDRIEYMKYLREEIEQDDLLT